MPKTETCWLCLRDIPADRYEAHLAQHAQVGRIMVEVEDKHARPVYVEALDTVIDLADMPGLNSTQCEKLRDLAAEAATDKAIDGRYPPTDALLEFIAHLMPGIGGEKKVEGRC